MEALWTDTGGHCSTHGRVLSGNFCRQCGEMLEPIPHCPACKSLLTMVDDPYCGHCGAKQTPPCPLPSVHAAGETDKCTCYYPGKQNGPMPTTPRPWRVDEQANSLTPKGTVLRGPDNYRVAEMYNGEPATGYQRDGRANAALAVAAVNVYDDAKELIGDLLADYLAECHRSYNLAKRPGRFYGEDLPLVKRARALLARMPANVGE